MVLKPNHFSIDFFLSSNSFLLLCQTFSLTEIPIILPWPNPPNPPSVLHPALTVHNISTSIKTVLTIAKSQYTTWSELFLIHAKAYQILDFLIPNHDDKSPQSSSVLKSTNPSLWSRIDVIVLLWIYATIDDDLVETILVKNTTAADAWSRLANIFSDNKNSRALFLEQEFSSLKMEIFNDVSSYCQELKSISDQLSNVGSPVSNDRLVLQMISGLTDAHDMVGSQIRHGDILPPFYKPRSMLVLEETARAQKSD
ncbi:hypothetical protein M5689_020424 [Euphorbia peplus]|nr:hypothetical protein M5689_020424 [Euphorbia peplus]